MTVAWNPGEDPLEGRHTVRVTLGETPEATVITIDGRRLENILRVALLADANGPRVARLTVHRFRPAVPDLYLGSGGIVETVDAGPGVDVQLEGVADVVELIEEQARESLKGSDTKNALHVFMIQGDDGRATTLADIVRNHERYLAIRATAGEDIGIDARLVTAAELDAAADTLRGQLAQSGDGEPRRPT